MISVFTVLLFLVAQKASKGRSNAVAGGYLSLGEFDASTTMPCWHACSPCCMHFLSTGGGGGVSVARRAIREQQAPSAQDACAVPLHDAHSEYWGDVVRAGAMPSTKGGLEAESAAECCRWVARAAGPTPMPALDSCTHALTLQQQGLPIDPRLQHLHSKLLSCNRSCQSTCVCTQSYCPATGPANQPAAATSGCGAPYRDPAASSAGSRGRGTPTQCRRTGKGRVSEGRHSTQLQPCPLPVYAVP